MDTKEKNITEFFINYLSSGELNNLKSNRVFIGSEMAFDLDLKEGDKINLMSSAFISTPIGSLPKQESFKVAGIFNTGFVEFDQNIVFLNIQDALSMFDKNIADTNIEIYLSNPLQANLYKEKIQKN